MKNDEIETPHRARSLSAEGSITLGDALEWIAFGGRASDDERTLETWGEAEDALKFCAEIGELTGRASGMA